MEFKYQIVKNRKRESAAECRFFDCNSSPANDDRAQRLQVNYCDE